MSSQTDEQTFDISENVKDAIRIVFTASTKLKVSLLISFCVFIILMIALTTNGWHTWKSGHAGLWTTCEKLTNATTCCSRIKNVIKSSFPEYVHATRAFMILGLLTATARLVYLGYEMRREFISAGDGDFNFATCCTNTSTAIFVFIAVIVYGAIDPEGYISDDAGLSWSFAFGIIAGILTVLEPIIIACV